MFHRPSSVQLSDPKTAKKYRQQEESDTHDKVVREALIERCRLLDTLHLLGGQRNVQRCEVFLELLDFSAADDGEHVRELVQMVCEGDYTRAFVDVSPE